MVVAPLGPGSEAPAPEEEEAALAEVELVEVEPVEVEPVKVEAPPISAEPIPVPPPTPPPPSTPTVEEQAPSGPEWSPGAQVFLRAEGRINPDFNGADNTAPDMVRVLERARIQLGATWGPASVFVQAQDARTWGFEGSTISNEANTDLHQGWAELGGSVEGRKLSGSIRAGRQEMIWGSQRIIGSLLWAAPARSFDAVRLRGTAGRWGADMFLAVLAPPASFAIPDPTRPDLPPDPVQSRGDQLAGGLISYAANEAFNIEAMTLADLADASMDAPTRDRQILDFGARIWGTPLEGLRYEAEGHGQTGHDNGVDHRAWAWVANIGYVHEGKRVKPGGKLSYAMASGSRCTEAPGEGGAGCGAATSSDFFNFYPTNHGHYGLVDLMGWRNMRNLEVAASLAADWISTSLTYHFFQLNESAGRWRNAGGGLVGSGWDITNTDNTLGHEIDFVASLKPWKPLMVQPGYGVFVPTKAGRTLGGPSAQHFVYLWIVMTF